MNFEQIVAKAQQGRDPSHGPSIVITVAGEFDNAVRNGVLALLKDRTGENGRVTTVAPAGSFGLYDLEPIVIIEKPGRPSVLYACPSEETATRLLKGVIGGDLLEAGLALCSLGEEQLEGIPRSVDLSLFRLQTRVALRNCGLIDPESIGDYIARDGYKGLFRALEMGREAVIEEVRTSGLRGRGGAGYPTAEKWKPVGEAEGDEKVVICNAVDGDPRARTAKLLLEGDPHSVLEGLLIAAYATGASRAVVCIGSEDVRANQVLENAMEQMQNYGLLGTNILDTNFACSIEVREVARTLVAGEETALLRTLAGRQPMPYLRGNQPLFEGLDGKPTVVNNIETLANASAILQMGAEPFAATGTGASSGGKVVTLSGSVLHGYTVEVPFGISLSSVVFDIGRIPGGKAIKAVQFGGPTGRLFSPDDLDIPLTFEDLEVAASLIGSGTLEVIAGNVCAVEMTEKLMSFVQGQSCGKCVFCREGTFQISDILKDIVQGEGKQQDLDLITELAEKMRVGTVCGFGRSAANPVLSSLRLFGAEYEAHIREKRCPWEGKS